MSSDLQQALSMSKSLGCVPSLTVLLAPSLLEVFYLRVWPTMQPQISHHFQTSILPNCNFALWFDSLPPVSTQTLKSWMCHQANLSSTGVGKRMTAHKGVTGNDKIAGAPPNCGRCSLSGTWVFQNFHTPTKSHSGRISTHSILKCSYNGGIRLRRPNSQHTHH